MWRGSAALAGAGWPCMRVWLAERCSARLEHGARLHVWLVAPVPIPDVVVCGGSRQGVGGHAGHPSASAGWQAFSPRSAPSHIMTCGMDASASHTSGWLKTRM